MTEEIKKSDEEIKKAEAETEKKPDGAAGAGADAAGDEDNLSPEQKIIDDLKSRAETAEKRAEKAEKERDEEQQRRNTAQKDAMNARERQIKAQEDSIASKVESAKASFEKAQQEYEDAYDSGDKKRLISAQVALNDAQAQMRGAEFQAEQFKSWKEGKGSSEEKSTSRETQYDFKTGTGDVIKLPQSAIDWAKKHPKLASDAEYTEAVYDADSRAKRRGIEIYSKEYFDFLESHVKKLGLENDDDDTGVTDPNPEPKKEEPKKSSEKQKSSTAVPVGSSTGSTGAGKKSKTFVMTSEMREAARFTYPDDKPEVAEEKYAKRQLEIQERRAKGEQV